MCEQKESLYTNVTQVHILHNKHLPHKHLFDLFSLYRKVNVVGKQHCKAYSSRSSSIAVQKHCRVGQRINAMKLQASQTLHVVLQNKIYNSIS